jgi:Ycf66 protein N-terminus
MVNAYLSWSSFVGIALAVAGAGLYFLRSLRPKLARDYDIFFSAVALLCGGILFFQGWRQDPILQFGQFMLTGSTIFFAVEAIRLRGAATEQARRSTPIVDEERPVSRNYRATYQDAEVEGLNAYDDSRSVRRISGTRDARSGRDEMDDMDDRAGRRSSPRARLDDRSTDRGSERAGRRNGTSRRPDRNDDYTAGPSMDRPEGRGRGEGRSGPRDDNRVEDVRGPRSGRSAEGRSQRPRPSEGRSRDRAGVSPSEYVDYRPVESDDDSWGDS